MWWLIVLIVVLVVLLVSIGIILIVKSEKVPNDEWIFLPFYQKIRHLGQHPPDYVHVLADKYAVKDIVQEQCPQIQVAKLVYVTDTGYIPELSDILEPDKVYMMKANNASRRNRIITVEDDRVQLTKIATRWIHAPFNTALTDEIFYGQISPKILIEEMIPDVAFEYRIFCFHGKPEYIKVKMHGSNKVSFYTPDWKKLDLKQMLTPTHDNLDKPEYLDQLIECAGILSMDIAFVCIDIMATSEGRLYFGEYTFCPNNASRNLVPDRYQEIFSNKWKFCDT